MLKDRLDYCTNLGLSLVRRRRDGTFPPPNGRARHGDRSGVNTNSSNARESHSVRKQNSDHSWTKLHCYREGMFAGGVGSP